MLTRLPDNQTPFEVAFYAWASNAQKITEIQDFLWEGPSPTPDVLGRCMQWVDDDNSAYAGEHSQELRSSFKAALLKFQQEKELDRISNQKTLPWDSKKIASYFPEQNNIRAQGALNNRKAAIVPIFIDSVQAWRDENSANVLQEDSQFDDLWVDYAAKLPEDLQASAGQPAMKQAGQVVWVSNYVANKNLEEVEKAALLAYLPVIQEKSAANEQLGRFDHELWQLKFDSQGQLHADREQNYANVQSIVIAELVKNPPREFEGFVKNVPTVENLSCLTIRNLLLSFVEGLQKNILCFINDPDVSAAIAGTKVTPSSVIEALAGVYYDFLVAYIQKKYPSLMGMAESGITSLSFIIIFVKNVIDQVKFPDNSSDMIKDFATIIEKILNVISFIEFSPIISPSSEQEPEQQGKLYQSLVYFRDHPLEWKAFLDTNNFPRSLNILDLVSEPFILNPDLSGFLPRDSAEDVLKKILFQNAAYFRDFNRKKNGDKDSLRAIHRLLNAFFNVCAADGAEQTEEAKNILSKQEEIQALITFDDNSTLALLLDSKELEEKIFTANLSVILNDSNLSTADKDFSQAVTAAAILWQHPSIWSAIEVEVRDAGAFKAIASEDKVTHLRLAVNWIQEKSLASKVNEYYAKNAESLNKKTSTEDRVKNLQVLIPAFLAQDLSPSRAFNKGAVHIDEFLVPESVRRIFSQVSTDIQGCENFEEEIALIVQKVLKAMLQDFKTLFPDPTMLPAVRDSAGKNLSAKEIILQLAALQLSYLGKIYQNQADLNGRVCGLISGRAEGVVNLRLMKEGSEENSIYDNLENEIDNVIVSGQSIKYETFGVDQGRNFSDFIFPANDFIVSLAKGQASRLHKNSPPEEKNRKIAEAEANASYKLMLDIFSLYGKVPPINFREALQGVDAALSACANNLCVAARDRKELELNKLVDEITKAAATSKLGKFYSKNKDEVSYEESLKEALDKNLDFPVYFNAERIERYLKKTIDGLITNTYGEAADKKPIRILLDSNLPLFIKLRMIGQIALGNTLYPPPVIDVGRMHSWQAQKIYKQLSCFSAVTEENILEIFTEFLKASGAPVANEVKNIEHVVQRNALLSMEMKVEKDNVLNSVALSNSEPPEAIFQFIQETEDLFGDLKVTARNKKNQDEFVSLIDRRLTLSIKSGTPMVTDWLHVLPASAIPNGEDEFVELIQELFTGTRLNVKFSELITAERQWEFVAAVAQTLIQYQPSYQSGAAEAEKKIIARVKDIFIPVKTALIAGAPKIRSELFGVDEQIGVLFEDSIKTKLTDSDNIEKELWSIVDACIKIAISHSKRNQDGATLDEKMDFVIAELIEYHDNVLVQNTFHGEFSAVILERAIHFLITHKNVLQNISFDEVFGDTQTLEQLNKRNELFGLASNAGEVHTLASLALARMSQPEVARQEKTLDFTLALDRKPLEDKSEGPVINGKIDPSLRIKTLANIWRALTTINPKTGQHDFDEGVVLSVAEYHDLFPVIKAVMEQAEAESRYEELAVILPVVFTAMRPMVGDNADMYDKGAWNHSIAHLITKYNQSNSPVLKNILLRTLVLAVGKNSEAEKFIANAFLLQAGDRNNTSLSELISLFPDEMKRKNVESNNHNQTKKSQREVTFKNQTEIFEDDTGRSDIYRKNDNEWPKKFTKSDTQKSRTKNTNYFNKWRIQQYLIEKIEALANIIGPIEISGRQQMLEIFDKDLPLTTKLNLIGHIAQGKVNDATLGNQYGLRRNSEVQKLYTDLCVFSGITEIEQVIPTFTTFLKNHLLFNQALVGVTNIEHHIQRYELIREGLRLIPANNFPYGSTIKQRFEAWVYNDKNLRDSSDACQAIDLFRQMLDDHKDEIDSAINKTRESGEKSSGGPREQVAHESAPRLVDKDSALDRAANEPFAQLFMKWVDFSVKTGESLKQEDLFLIGAQVTDAETKVCYQNIQGNTALKLLKKQALTEALRACHEKRSGKSKEQALEKWEAIVSAYGAQHNSTSQDVSNNVNLPELLKYYEGSKQKTNQYELRGIESRISEICNSDYLESLKEVLGKFKTFYEAYSPKALFYGNKPTGIQEIINMIGDGSPAVDVMLRLRDVATERLNKKIYMYDTRLDDTKKVYEVVQEFFTIARDQSDRKPSRSAVGLLDKIRAAAPTNQEKKPTVS